MTKLPKPLNRQSYFPLIRKVEERTSDLLSVSDAATRYVDSVWDMESMTEKELLALHQSLRKQHGSSVVIVKLNTR